MFDTSRANCVSLDPEMFFPVGKMDSYERAFLIKVCSNCEIFKNCLDYSLEYKVDGFWAGTLPEEREVKRKELGIKGITLDAQYKEQLMAQTPEAKKARAKRVRLREAG